MSPAVGRGPNQSQWTGERASRGTRGRNLRGLLALIKPYRRRAYATLVALVVGTAATLAPPLLARAAIDKGIEQQDIKTLVLVVIAFLFSALLVWAMTYAQTYLVGWVGQRALADLRIRIFKHLQTLPIGFYESRPAGVLISRITNDVEALDSLVTDSVVTLFQAGLTLIGTVGILLYLDVKLALITFLVLPLLLAGSLWFRHRLRRRVPPHARDDRRDHRLPAGDLLGIRVVRSFAQEPVHEAQFAELNQDNRDANMTTVRLNAAYFPTVEMLSGVAVAAIVLYGGLQAIKARHGRHVVAFVAALSNLFEPIQQLSQLYATYQSGMAALEKIFQLLDVRPDLHDRPARSSCARIAGEVDFDDVSFAYARRRNGRDQCRGPPPARRSSADEQVLALDHVDLHIPPGRRSRWSARPAPASRPWPS